MREKWSVEASAEAINIAHQTGWPVKNLEMISEKFLCPATDLMDWTIILKDLAHSTAIAEPKEFRAPKILAILADTPTATRGFANERMEVAFAIGAFAGSKPKWPKTGTGHGNVKIAKAFGAKKV